MKNRIYILTCIFSILLSVCCFANAYENVETTTLAKGVTLNKVTIFNENGWTYLDVIEIDMDEKTASIGPLISETGVSHFSNIKNMVSTHNAIAGLNGDYFAKRPNTTNRGQSIGFLGSNGEILVSSADENISSDTMASFILSKDNNIIYSYLTDTITITSPKTKNTFEACDINKYVPYNSIGIYTSKWSNLSIGNSEGKEIIEVVVEDNIVKEIRQYLEPTSIPENGYLLSAYGPDAIEYILTNFEVGDKIEYNVELNLNLEKMQFGISGGTMLVEKGKIPTFTHIIWGNNEMSAIGTNKKEDTIYLIACTSKNGNTIGITQKQFAEVIKDYGVYNALCLDGGGSTTMVAKQLGTTNISTILSEQSYLRPVANGIGIFTKTQPTNKISKLSIQLSDTHIFVGNTASFNISAYDTNYYVMDIDMSKLKISFNNTNAKYEDGKIIALKKGSSTITVEYLGKKISQNIEILGDIYNLEISPKETNISINDNVNFKLIATDKNGFSDTISNNLVEWEIVNGNGTIDNGIYTPTKHETVIVSANIDNVTVYAKININKEITETFDSFETLQGTFSAYPQDISDGKVDISKNKKKDGTHSLRLNYNFKNTEQAIRGAYFDYNTPLNLPNNISEIGIWIYNPKKNDNSIKSQYIDKKGTTYIDVLVDKMDWTGWKYVTYPSYAKISKISSIYVAQSNQEIANSSYIYIDALTVTYLGNDNANLLPPSDILPKDIDERKLDNSYCITLIDTLKTPSTLFDQIVNNRIISDINNNSELLLTYKTISQNILDNINVETEIISNYYVTDKKDLRVICVNNSKKGIRATDYSQWEKLVDDIDTRKNVLLILSSSLDSFDDTQEKELLISSLQEKSQNTNSKCWIVQYGTHTNIENYNGIKIITIGKISANNSIEDVLNNYRYINIYSNSTDISYEIKEIF